MTKLYLLSLLVGISVSISAQTVRYVRSDSLAGAGGTSWAAAGRDLQATISASSSGDFVYVAAGTYKPAAGGSFLMKDGVQLLGGFSGSGSPALSDRDWNTYPTILAGNGRSVFFNYLPLTTGMVLDGFTVRGGGNTLYGGAIYNASDANWQIRNCLFENNRANTYGGALYFASGTMTLTNCTFRNNAVTGTTAGGGAIYLVSATSAVLEKCRFIENTATQSGGAVHTSSFTSLRINNCRFTANRTTGSGAGVNGGAINLVGAANATASLTNCLFTGNTGVLAPALYAKAMGNLILTNCTISGNEASGTPKSALIFTQLLMTIQNSIVYGNSGGINGTPVRRLYCLIQGVASATGSDRGIIPGSTDPLFVNPVPDSESGNYTLRSCSPAIGKGDNASIPSGTTTDLSGSARIQSGTVDLGAYETAWGTAPVVNTATTAIPAGNTQSERFQAANATVHYLGDNCTSLLASVTSSGFSGLTTTKVWVESSQPGEFVSRHVEITPHENAGSVNGTITLYFKQAEFTAFNAVSPVKLPTGPADAAGIANLRVEKRSGQSHDLSGLPASYPGTPVTIDPADSDIVWNAAASRWEITFSVTGFSGFFVKATDAPLPLRLLRFTATRENAASRLDWQTADEERVSHFAIERSSDGNEFATLATIPARNAALQAYSFVDHHPFSGIRYYRLKMVDQDGFFSRSKTLALVEEGSLAVGPNPARHFIRVLSHETALIGSEVQLLDISGKVRQKFTLRQATQDVPLTSLPAGIYLLRFSDARTIRFERE